MKSISLKKRSEFLELQRAGIYRMLPLGRAPSVLSVPVPCHPAHLTHCRHHTQPAKRPHTRGCSISLPCCAGHKLFLSTQEAQVALRCGENPPRTAPMWPARTETPGWGDFPVQSEEHTSIPPPGYSIFPALLHLFLSESSSSLHSIRHSPKPLLRV